MNKTILRSLVIMAAMIAALLSGCTHNNGDIGSKFGSWKQTAMTIDGEANPEYKGNIFWGFQHGSLTFTYMFYDHGIPVNPPTGEPRLVFTSWSEEDGYIIIDTNFSDDQGTFRYTPPEVLLLPAQTANIRLKILSESSREMRLEYLTSDGKQVVYTLRKWG